MGRNIDECASVPDSLKRARACRVCSLIKTYEQFKREGCDNCESFLGLCGYPDKIRECTSSDYDGIIALMKPRANSFISKTKKLTRYVPGTYAVGVSGRLPDWVEEIMMDEGISYVPRDGTIDDKYLMPKRNQRVNIKKF
ncbi:transcription elongation factor SPT4 [Gigaspora margarita]|uniref:Transcription elongation factor SPT4 n=1 Tax=Gigaspora margarita TaxID=4874 RepID=A0A8H3WXL6_GIGMA|nr:transcription elongation factor SPT4 [Gigaspora margarita]